MMMLLKRSLAGLLVGGLLSACAATPSDESADVSIPPVDTDQLDPLDGPTLCITFLAQAIDSPTTLGTGKANINDPCDWFIGEQSLGENNAKVIARMKTLSQQGIAINTKATCEASYISAVVYGQRAPHWHILSDGTPVWNPGGTWEQLDTSIEHGRWSGGSCSFPYAYQDSFITPSLPIFNDPDSPYYKPYSKIRVGTRSKMYGVQGLVAATIQAGFNYFY